jgi:hypothetical protein
MKFPVSKTTLCLTAVAIVCYAFSWTGVAIGLGILGLLFEAVSDLSAMRDAALNEASSAKQEGGSDREGR